MATVLEQAVPPLAPGDKLSRDEFFRRWELHPEIKNAELIGGIVYMASPVSHEHGLADGRAGGWLQYYSAFTPGTDSGHNTTSCMLEDSPQPDIYLRILREFGGGSWVGEDNKLHGAPELLTEISRSSVSYDLNAKLELYQEAEIPEYLAILLYEQEIRWNILVNGKYVRLEPNADGIWGSRVFPGLWLDGKAILAGNMSQVFARLQEGLASSEHQAFVDELARRRQT